MTCRYCDGIAKKENIVFEDETIAVMLHHAPAMPGHLLALPKEHFTIIEQTPDKIVRKMAVTANKASTALIQVLGATGTNLIIENGTAAEQQVPHLAINIIPRVDGDGLNFQWQPKKVSDEQMGLIELQLKEQTKSLGVEAEKKEPIMLDDAKAKGEAVQKSNYLTRQLRRMP
ncbi:HIT family protein [Candidatus Woesearchaeota archaeon]|nr:HIT family protein [Candidatus Woesearchaeota archaeon]